MSKAVLSPLDFRPGVHTDITPYTGEGQWIDSDKVRFRDGLPEKFGGWLALIEGEIVGVPRAAHAWNQNDGTRNLAIGTSKKLYLYQGGTLNDITPIRDSGTLGTDPFTTDAAASAVVTVNDTSHGVTAGSYVTFSGATGPIDGIPASEFNAEHAVTEVVDADNYKITLTTPATSGSVSGGGASVAYAYQINIGNDSATAGYGWGAGAWGAESWGDARSSSGLTLPVRIWSLDNWGEDLVACPVKGNIYLWDASAGVATRAAIIAAAPTNNLGITVSGEDSHLIAFGADGDPRNIQWCDQRDYTNWTPAADSTADERNLLQGSRIVGWQKSKGEILIWTDVSFHGLRYVGDIDYAFALRFIAGECGLIGQNAAIDHNGVTYWMGSGAFHRYDGRVQTIPCTLLRRVFDDIDMSQVEKVHAGVNAEWGEVMYFYPTLSGAGEIDRVAINNINENLWYPATFDRTFWMDKEPFPFPMAANSTGTVYEHENGSDDDGSGMEFYIESGDHDIGDGDQVMLITGLVPDFVMAGGACEITLKARRYPNATQTTKGPYEVTANTKFIKRRIRGRHLAVRFGGDDLGLTWRMGRVRVWAKPDGGK